MQIGNMSMSMLELLKEAYKDLFENRPVSWSGHMSPLFPKGVVVTREPGETLSINATLDNIKEDTTK